MTIPLEEWLFQVAARSMEVDIRAWSVREGKGNKPSLLQDGGNKEGCHYCASSNPEKNWCFPCAKSLIPPAAETAARRQVGLCTVRGPGVCCAENTCVTPRAHSECADSYQDWIDIFH